MTEAAGTEGQRGGGRRRGPAQRVDAPRHQTWDSIGHSHNRRCQVGSDETFENRLR